MSRTTSSSGQAETLRLLFRHGCCTSGVEAIRAGTGGFMRRQALAVLGVLALALLSVACSATDPGITTKVTSRLDTDRDINASQIHVATRQGVVTLSGTVDNPTSKSRAASIARTVEGVKNVVNNLAVSPQAASAAAPADDSAITQAVKEKLQS